MIFNLHVPEPYNAAAGPISGNEGSSMAFCTNCGHSISTDVKFCGECGSSTGLGAHGAAFPSQRVEAPPAIPADADDLAIVSRLNDAQRMVFLSEKKSTVAGVFLCLFLGGVGGHQFYLGNTGTGVVYLLFCWTFIPAIIALCELFTISSRVRRYNRNLALRIGQHVTA